MSVSAEFTCRCGKQKAWIEDGEENKDPCPSCGRKYRGEYNPQSLTIDAIEVIGKRKVSTGNREPTLKTIMRLCKTLGVTPNELLGSSTDDIGRWALQKQILKLKGKLHRIKIAIDGNEDIDIKQTEVSDE